MGIRPIGDKPTQPSKRKGKLDHGSGKEFRKFLDHTGSASDDHKIQSLFESVETAVDALLESRAEAALKEYRKRVREFLEEVLSKSREVRIITRESIYEDPLMIVKIIDTKLDELASLVIREEVERGEMMRLIEEIQGIMVDLYR